MGNPEASQQKGIRKLERTWRVWIFKIEEGLGEGPRKPGFALDWVLSASGIS